MRKILVILFVISFSMQAFSQTEEPTECDCYYHVNCGSSSGGKVPGPVCERGNCGLVPKQKNDGLCKTVTSVYSYNTLHHISKFINIVFIEIEKTSRQGGGKIDGVTIQALKNPEISDQLYMELKNMITGLFIPLAIGETSYHNEPYLSGYYTLPTDFTNLNDFGEVKELDNTHIKVLTLVRQALVSEINSPLFGNYDKFLNKIPILAPEFKPYGRCEYPHPTEHGHDFPFVNALTCMKNEIYTGVDQLISVPCLTNEHENTFVCQNGRSFCIPKDQVPKYIDNEDIGIRCSELLVNNLNMELFPNPASLNLNISAFLPENSYNKFEIYDFFGEEVYHSEPVLGEGIIKEFLINVDSFKNGLHVLKFQVDDQIVIKRIEILKQ